MTWSVTANEHEIVYQLRSTSRLEVLRPMNMRLLIGHCHDMKCYGQWRFSYFYQSLSRHEALWSMNITLLSITVTTWSVMVDEYDIIYQSLSQHEVLAANEHEIANQLLSWQEVIWSLNMTMFICYCHNMKCCGQWEMWFENHDFWKCYGQWEMWFICYCEVMAW